MSERPAGRERVLFSTPPPRDADNPYLHQLVAGLSSQIDVEFLSARTALFWRPDVFHVHWPHQLYRANGVAKSVIKYALSTILLARLHARGTPVVLTVHNRRSHEGDGFWGGRMLARLDRLVTRRIYLNEAVDNDLRDGLVILHGDYREWIAGLGIATDAPMPATASVALFGLLRPYKGIESLIAAAADADVPLQIAGAPLDAEYGAALAALHPLDARHLSDAELADFVHAASLIVLPYERMYNSGALLYALSLGRPVLAPRSAVNEAIAAEVGGGWLSLYDGDLSLAVLPVPTTEAPDLSRRGWPESIERHVALYRELTA